MTFFTCRASRQGSHTETTDGERDRPGAPRENVDSVQINAVKVAVGDVVSKGQPLLEVQADKAQLEVPAPMSGRIAKLLVKEGDEIAVGKVYCVIEGDSVPAPTPATPRKEPTAKVEPVAPSPQPSAPRVLAPEPRPVEKAAPIAVLPGPAHPPGHGDGNGGPKVTPAGPATRRLAREFGIDLGQVAGSGRFGRVTEEDIKTFVRDLAKGGLAAPVAGGAVTQPALPNFEQWGTVERQKLSPIRKATGRQMSLAWNLIPHVTQHDEADITELEAFRKEQQAKGGKLTVTAFVLKASAIMLKRFETFNASLDSAGGQVVLKRYYHIGVAVDTPGGLVVPVIRDVDKKSVMQLAGELTAIAEKARGGKLDMKEMQGGTFTITNLGGIGGTAFTPIVNWPEVAILGLSRSRLHPVYRDGNLAPRLLMPLSLSYDHRVIDGAAAARFARQLAELLEEPLLLALHA